MSEIITVDHVSKVYRLGAIGGATLQEDLARWWARMRNQTDPTTKLGPRTKRVEDGDFWALNDVSFSVNEGEVLGVIGRNGAGKSTLLKILSQVTGPTSGSITLRGRVASLLEVGTGFHPDLSGRENIFLNGAILGMNKREIRLKLDAIVAFSECETFIDTPVKRYSSGMYVRLAFAVAAHLDPEILIVDEVLAVGDAQFQRKCLGKMGEVSRGGRTVLFVSHNMSAVRRLCRRAVVLDGGRVSMIADAEPAIAAYLMAARSDSAAWSRPADAPTPEAVHLVEVKMVDATERIASVFGSTDPIRMVMTVQAPQETRPLQIAFRLTNHEGVAIFSSTNTDESRHFTTLAPGLHRFTVDIPSHFLAPGAYNVGVAVHIPRAVLFDYVDSVNFSVEETGADFGDDRLGVVTPQLSWRHTAGAAAEGASAAQLLKR